MDQASHCRIEKLGLGKVESEIEIFVNNYCYFLFVVDVKYRY